MRLLEQAYLRIIPELALFFVGGPAGLAREQTLAHGKPQRRESLARSLTTTSSVVAALNSILVGAVVGDAAALRGRSIAVDAMLGAVASVISAVLHVWYAARFRAQ
jgi:hypothetical protein